MTKPQTDENRRAHERIDMEINAEIYVPNQDQPIPVHTRDISMGGLFVFLKPEQMPVPGTIVKVRLKTSAKFDAPALDMEVVYNLQNGMGLRYLD
jgi:c-di-GMP-binding flagellar brake protein YcgR